MGVVERKFGLTANHAGEYVKEENVGTRPKVRKEKLGGKVLGEKSARGEIETLGPPSARGGGQVGELRNNFNI